MRDARIDRLKTIALAFVLVWHLHPIYVDGVPFIARAVRFFEFEISLTAVPTFLGVSLYLFYPKASSGPGARLTRLATIFVFWAGVQTALAFALAHPRPAPSWLWLGGPELPVIGGSVFYYLFDLLILTALAWLYARLPARARGPLAIATVLGSLAWFEWSLLRGGPIPYFRLDAFLLYVPTAFYLARLVRFRWLWLALWAAGVAQDLALGRLDDFPYGRATVYFGALALYGFVMSGPEAGGRFARWVAMSSLGLYAVHKYWQMALMLWKGHRSWNVTLASATLHLAALALFVLTLLLSAGTVELFRRTPLRRFVN